MTIISRRNGHHSKLRQLCMTPKRIILVRHGESEANVDEKKYTTTADWVIPLTPKGMGQAHAAGMKLKNLIHQDHVCIHYSPYRRATETASAIMSHIDSSKVLFDGEDPRLREQDVGNFQDTTTMQSNWQERDRFGRFFYRFPNGESGADVCDRVSSFSDSMMRSFRLHSRDPDTNVIVCSHGLTIRLFILRWFHFSVGSLELLQNPPNASLVILQRKLISNGGRIAEYEMTKESLELVGITPEMLDKRKRSARWPKLPI
eukprot:PhF_6_TR40664/c0_g2_i1/m.61083